MNRIDFMMRQMKKSSVLHQAKLNITQELFIKEIEFLQDIWQDKYHDILSLIFKILRIHHVRIKNCVHAFQQIE